MFELTTPTTLKLDKLNPRVEHHGEALVPAVDLKCTLTTNNKVLDQFHPKLRAMLFCSLPAEQAAKRAAEDGQAEMQLPVSDLPNITFPKLEYPVKWDLELSGYTTRVDFGLGGNSDLVINLCVLKNFKFSPIEGGSCEVEFTISSAADIDANISGKLSMNQQQDITITLLGPNLTDGGVIDASAGSGAPGTRPAAEPDAKPKKQSKAVKDATAAFLDANGAAQPH